MFGLMAWWLFSCADLDCERGPIDVQIGTGVTKFEPLAEGEDVTMVFGIQGGWHIDVALRVEGVGTDVEVRPEVRRVSDGERLAGDQLPSLLLLADYRPGACRGDALGVRAFLDDATPAVPYPEFICSLAGERLQIDVDVSDFSERSATASIEVTARTDPNQFCP